MKKTLIAACAAVIALGVASAASADTTTVELGWGNITPCSRVVWNNTGPLGMSVPTVETADQRVTAYADVEAATAANIQNDIQQCAVQGAAAAGLGAILASPGAAMPAFNSTFGACMAGRSQNYANISLRVSAGQCMW